MHAVKLLTISKVAPISPNITLDQFNDDRINGQASLLTVQETKREVLAQTIMTNMSHMQYYIIFIHIYYLPTKSYHQSIFFY
jgi:hypothetical protein